MNFKRFTKYLKFTHQQRTGIFLLFVIIVILQGVYFFFDFTIAEKTFPEKEQWMSLQSEIDAMKFTKSNEKPKVYTFNPNFI
ncbi:MAG: helix-hairpin-helix domain-containing protein, partial [Flavobacterium sp.]